MLKYALKWLKFISKSYSDNSNRILFSFLKSLDDSVDSIVKFLHTCLIIDEDMMIFNINKQLEEKKLSLHSESE